MSEQLVPIADAEKQLNVSRQTIWKYINEGQLEACLIGKRYQFKQEWLDDFISRRKVKPQKGTQA